MASVLSGRTAMPPLQFVFDSEYQLKNRSPTSCRGLDMRGTPQTCLTDVTADVDFPTTLINSVIQTAPSKMEKALQKLIRRAFKERHNLPKIKKTLAKPAVNSYVGVIRDEYGHTILHHSIIHGRGDVVELLFYMGFWKQLYHLAVKEDTGSKYSGMTSIQLAEAVAEQSKSENTAKMLGTIQFCQVVSEGMGANMELFFRDRVEAGRKLRQLEDNGTLNRTTAGGYVPFLFAVASGDVGLMSDTLRRGVTVIVRNGQEQNALHIAAKLAHTAVVDKLLDIESLNPEDRDKHRRRPLEYAILNGDQETLEVFVRHSVYPDKECHQLARQVFRQERERELRREFSEKRWLQIKKRQSRENAMVAYIEAHMVKDREGPIHRADSSMLDGPYSERMDGSDSGSMLRNQGRAGNDSYISPPISPEKPTQPVVHAPARIVHVVAGIIHEMILSDTQHYYPYDIQSALARTSAPMEELLDEQGHSVLHNIVVAAKPEFLPLVFYLGKWGILRDQEVDQNSSSDYKGLTPRKVAEKLLPRAKGPQLLDEFDHYDQLWDILPDLSRMCVLGEDYAIQHFINGAPNPIIVLNETDTSGFNCLPYAVATGNPRAVQLLISYGADVHLLNDRNQSALHIAAILGRNEIIPLLTPTSDVNLPDKSDCRPVDYAAINGNEETMNIFREQGVPPDNVCVSLAARHGRLEMVRHLLDTYKLDLSGRDRKGRTPLLAAAANGHLSTIKLLLERGADITATDKQRRNCLHLSVESKIEGCISVLLDHAKTTNCDSQILNQQDYFSGREIILLVRGRDRGRQAWHYVQVERDLVHKFNEQMKRGSIDVKHYGKIQKSGFGRSPDRAVRDQMEELTNRRLAECTPDMTPLHLAAFRDQADAIKAFLKFGANPNVEDSFGLTPLHLVAMRGSSSQNFEVAKLLEDHKAEFLRKSKEGKTAADVAGNNDHVELENYFRGLEYNRMIKMFRENMLKKLEEQLNVDKLETLRQGGSSVRRHVIDSLRDVSIDVNEQLFGLGSGPIMEATPDEPRPF